MCDEHSSEVATEAPTKSENYIAILLYIHKQGYHK